MGGGDAGDDEKDGDRASIEFITAPVGFAAFKLHPCVLDVSNVLFAIEMVKV